MFDFFNDITFANKEMLWLLLIVPVIAAWYIWKNKSYNAELKISSLNAFAGIKKSFKHYLRHSLIALRLLAIALLIIVLARPQSRSRSKDVKPNRLEAAKEVAQDFIDSRPNDRIGLVIFSGESFTQCPLTTDHAVIKNLFSGIHTGMIADGTAIGNGLATAVTRVKDSKAKSKVIILLTDGVNNQGSVAPLTAAEIAKTFGVRVYTIGVGTMGKALAPIGMYLDGSYEYG